MGEYVLARGHRLTGVDQAARLLALARARLPQATWIASRIEDFRPTTPFAGVICWDALFHLERSAHRDLLHRIAGMLRDDGRLMLTAGGSAHPPFVDTMFGESFFYDSHPPDVLLAMVREAGFEVVVAEFLNPPVDDRDKGRLAVVARRVRAARARGPRPVAGRRSTSPSRSTRRGGGRGAGCARARA